MISNIPDRPCEVCKHRGDEHYEPVQTRYANSDTRCRVVTFKFGGWRYKDDDLDVKHCPCYQYQEMPNPEYLEYLYEKKLCK